ncbi:hypothetical protein T05_13639, partial [Trichinella murrelli]
LPKAGQKIQDEERVQSFVQLLIWKYHIVLLQR